MTFTISEYTKVGLFDLAIKNNATHKSTLSEEMPPNIRKVKERIRRLSDDTE